MRAFIDQYRHAYGVESICQVMQIAPSGYWRYAAQQRNPALRYAQARRDDLNDMACLAFTQDIPYDLEVDGTAVVVFQGLRIMVLKATGTSIQYIVEKPFAAS